MEYCQYYEGLSPKELAHHDSWLIICIEAAWYCESYNQKSVRYSHLRARCDEVLNEKTNGARSDFGGSFDSFIHSIRGKRFLRVVKVNKKETQIYPKTHAIQNEVKGRQSENFASRDRKLFRLVGPDTTLQHHKPVVEPPVLVSESLTRQVTKVRAPPPESVAISEGIGIVVTRANSKEVL
jgi:hypothetical protein